MRNYTMYGEELGESVLCIQQLELYQHKTFIKSFNSAKMTLNLADLSKT